MRIMAFVFLVSMLAGCGNDAATTKQTGITNASQSEPEAEKKIDLPPIKNASNLSEAIDMALPEMADFVENQTSTGAVLLAIWASDKLKWVELQKVPSGKYGLVMKDPDSQRGKRICATGQIVEIVADNSLASRVYIGGMFDESFNVYRFIATGSTGELMAGSRAKFCGVVTGKNDYSNSSGGVAHAVHLIGMFALKENTGN